MALIRVILSLISFALLASCSKSTDNSKVIAKIAGDNITENDIKAALLSRRSSKTVDKEKKVEYLEGLIEKRLYALAAEDEGLTKDSVLARRQASIEKRIYHQIYREDFVRDQLKYDEERLKKYYEAHKAELSDSLNPKTFYQLIPTIAEKIFLQSADVDSFYQENIKRYTRITKEDTVVTPLDSIRDRVQSDFVRDYRQKLVDDIKNDLYEQYEVEMVDPRKELADSEIEAYYNKNKERYYSPEQYELYHIEGENENAVKQAAKGAVDLEAFKKAASEKSDNAWTSKKDGYIGFVKKGHSFPYGIGMFPSLYNQLDSLLSSNSSLKTTDPIKNPITKKWHIFAVTQKKDRALKPLDRVKTLVRQNFAAEHGETIAVDQALAKYKGGTVLFGDVQFLKEEIPERYRKRYTRQQLTEFLLIWDLATLAARDVGIAQKPLTQARVRQEKDNYWARHYQDSIVNNAYGYSQEKLKSTFENNWEYFVKSEDRATFSERYNQSVAIFLSIPPEQYELEYRINPEKYTVDGELLPMDSVKSRLFTNLRSQFSRKPKERFVSQLKDKYKVKIVDPEYVLEKPTNATAEFKKAQDLHMDRKLNQAIEQYDLVRESFPERTSLQDSVCMGKAQVYVEMEKYKDALREYRRLLYLYPESANNYKAQFMIGFIYAENLKEEDKAVDAFKVLLDKYPKSDLADDADWMIRNIESGGALMPTLEES